MKTKENLVVRQVAGTWAVLPTASKVLDFDGMLTLNDAGLILWRLLEKGSSMEDLASALMQEYDVDREQALADVGEFVATLTKAGCIE
jgi:hypothetical protein